MTVRLTTWQLVRKLALAMFIQIIGIVGCLESISNRAWGWLILSIPVTAAASIGLFFDVHDWKAPRR